MRLAFLSAILDYPWGGADTLWTRAAQAARDRGDALLVAVSPQVAANEQVSGLGAQVVPQTRPPTPVTAADRLRSKWRRVFPSGDRVTADVDAFRPDLVIVSLGGTYDLASRPAWCAWLARGSAPFRLIANCQDERPDLDEGARRRMRVLFERADRVYFVSHRNLEVTREHLGATLPNARVVQNPLRWKPADSSPWPDGETRLAAVARLETVKGLHCLLPALAQALAAEPLWRLNIFGRGPEEAALRRQAAGLGLEGRVAFRGYVRDLRDIWAENHLLLSPALEEGVPMTIPEAMLCGRPVLATKVGGAADWITDGDNGFLSSDPAPDTLAHALRRAWDTRSTWREMGERAARAAAARYDPQDFVQVVKR